MRKSLSLGEGGGVKVGSDLKVGLKTWQDNVYHPMKTRSSQKNKNTEMVTAGFPFKSILFSCKHAGGIRSRGHDIRPNQKYLARRCPVLVSVSLKHKRKAPHYVINKIIDQHNHETGKGLYSFYCDNRLLNLQEKEKVSDLIKYKLGTTEIKQFVKDNIGKPLLTQDIQNLRDDFKLETRAGRTDGRILLDHLLTLVSKSNGNSIHVEVDDHNELTFLIIQTNFMKNLAKKYSDVIMIDATYKLNWEGLILYILLCEDSETIGRPIAYIFVKNETGELLRQAFERVILLSPSVLNCKVLIFDKDFTEINIFRKKIPEATILLCIWHVLKVFKQKVRETDLKKEKKQELMACLHAMVYSFDEQTYSDHLKTLLNLGPKKFVEYFLKNWDNCTDMWVLAFRKHLGTLGNNTNNRIESHNQKLKFDIKYHYHFHECVEALLSKLEDTQNSILYANFNQIKTFADTRHIDSLHLRISVNCSAAATRLIFEQIEKFEKAKLIYEIEINNNVTEVSFKSKKYAILNNLSCSCQFNSHYILPCAHLFFARMKLEMDLFSLEMVGNRWHKSSFSELTEPNNSSASTHTFNNKISKKAIRSREQKFNTAKVNTTQLASHLSECGTREFSFKNDFLSSLLTFWRENYFTGESDHYKSLLTFISESLAKFDSSNPTTFNDRPLSPVISEHDFLTCNFPDIDYPNTTLPEHPVDQKIPDEVYTIFQSNTVIISDPHTTHSEPKHSKNVVTEISNLHFDNDCASQIPFEYNLNDNVHIPSAISDLSCLSSDHSDNEHASVIPSEHDISDKIPIPSSISDLRPLNSDNDSNTSSYSKHNLVTVNLPHIEYTAQDYPNNIDMNSAFSELSPSNSDISDNDRATPTHLEHPYNREAIQILSNLSLSDIHEENYNITRTQSNKECTKLSGPEPILNLDNLATQFSVGGILYSEFSKVGDNLKIPINKRKRGRAKGSSKGIKSFSGKSSEKISQPNILPNESETSVSNIPLKESEASISNIPPKGSEDTEVINIDDVSEGRCVTPDLDSWIENLDLKDMHKQILLTGGWLDDSIINAAGRLILKLNPNSNCQDTIVGQILGFKVVKDPFIQIVHTPCHWLTITTLNCPPNTVAVYDSLNQPTPCNANYRACTYLKKCPG